MIPIRKIRIFGRTGRPMKTVCELASIRRPGSCNLHLVLGNLKHSEVVVMGQLDFMLLLHVCAISCGGVAPQFSFWRPHIPNNIPCGNATHKHLLHSPFVGVDTFRKAIGIGIVEMALASRQVNRPIVWRRICRPGFHNGTEAPGINRNARQIEIRHPYGFAIRSLREHAVYISSKRTAMSAPYRHPTFNRICGGIGLEVYSNYGFT